MTIFCHLVPQNVFGTSPPLNPVQGAFILHDVARAIYAQIGASPATPTLVGYVPATDDGFGGLTQLARDFDFRSFTIPPSGVTASLSGTTLTITYPQINVLWDGVVQSVAPGSTSLTVSTGTWYLSAQYNWGLTDVRIVSTIDLSQNYVVLGAVAVDTGAGTAVIGPAPVTSKLMQTLCVAGPTNTSYSISTSDANGNMPW